MARTRSTWGWGFEDAAFTAAQALEAAPGIPALLGFPAGELEEPVPLERVTLPEPRVAAPAGDLGARCSQDHRERATHSYGKSYLDTVRAFRGVYEHVPDVVARPRDEGDVAALLEWAADANVAVVPYGGGTSVVGGVEPRIPGRFDGALSLDLGALDGLLELDEVSRAARIGAGASGPRVEELLGAHGLTMRFFPQSFELSTLGGWVATRAGGHFATKLTHVDDLVESVRAITPSGAWESRRLPGSGAGPSPDRMLLGSEGALGVITDAWVRVQPRPEHRASRAVRFATFLGGAEAVRALAQSGLDPANCRLIDELEALQTGAGDGTHAVLVLGFESTDHPVEADLAEGLRDLPRARGNARPAARACRRRRGIRRRVARGVHPHALPAGPAAAARHPLGHVRDRDHLGALPRVPRDRARRGPRGARRALPGHVPLHPRVPRRPGAVHHGDRAGTPGRRGRAVARDEAGGGRGDHRRRRDDHPSSCGRPRPPAVVRRASARTSSRPRCAGRRPRWTPPG